LVKITRGDKKVELITIVLETEEEQEAMYHALNYCGEHYLDKQSIYPNNMTRGEYDFYRDKLWEAFTAVLDDAEIRERYKRRHDC